MLLLSLADIKKSITMIDAIDATEKAFMQLAQKEVVMPLRSRVNIEEEQAVTLTMPAFLTQEKALGLKVVSVFPNNHLKNKPSINGFIILLDAKTGEPIALMDGIYLTALRTGAVSGLATKYFAKEDATQLAILGSGAQAITQVEAVCAVRPIKQIAVWSRNKNNADKFAKMFEDKYKVQIYNHAAEAVKRADIICTATNSTTPLIHLKDLSPSVHINAIGAHTKAMQEIGSDILARSTVIVDKLDAALEEAGEVIHAIKQQRLKKENIIELGDWLINQNKADKNNLTVFKSVGLAMQDVSVAHTVYQNAILNQLGTNTPYLK